jgi:pimeloyl-ACP methyl ester carboxylesterase
MRTWIFALGLIFGSTGLVQTARSQQVYSVTWPTTHAAPPATLPDTSPSDLAAYRLGLAFYSESNVVNLITDHVDALGIPAKDAARYKKLFGEQYRLIENDPVFRDAPSALSYCFSAEKPAEGFAVVYCPKKLDAKLPPLVFLHGYGGSFLWSQQLLAEGFPNRLIICPAFGICSESMPPAYLSECLQAVQKRAGRPIGAPILIGFSLGGFGAAKIFTQSPNHFHRLILLGAYPPNETVARFNQTMSVRCLAGAREDFVQSGTFASFMRAIQPRVKDFEFQTIPDGDHFFMLEKKEATLKVLRSWIETPVATKAASKSRSKTSSVSPVP